jgi:hypothetical protein
MKLISIAITIAILLLLGTGLNSCKNPGEGITIDINTNVLKAPMAIRFANAISNAPHQPGNFLVTIGGRDAASVVTMTNKTVFKVTDGMIFLALKKGLVPSEENPIIFTLAAQAPGFTPATYNLRITNDKPMSIVIPMVEYANPVSGTVVKIQENPLVAGMNTAGFLIQTPIRSGLDQQAIINISAGTQFLNADEKVINASKLESRVVYYGTTPSQSSAALPGDGAFATAGFLLIDMYASGTEVKTFSKPLSVKMGISKDVMNPLTGVKVKAGDVVPAWSLADKSGQWTFESNATIVAEGNGLNATFSTMHPGYWNLGWAMGLCGNKLTLIFNAKDYVGENYLIGILSDKGFTSSTIFSITDQSSTEFQAPNGNLKVVVRDVKNLVVAETSYFDACSAGSKIVNMPMSASTEVIDVDLLLKGTCPNKPVKGKISTWIRVYEPTKGVQSSRLIFMLNGKIHLTVRNNVKYILEALNGETWKTTQIIFSKNNFTFSGSITGSSVYLESSKKLVLEAQFSLPDCH